MQHLPRFSDPDLLVGAEHFSDAGVYRIAPNLALVQSVDFFPPVVNDPYMFGQIAAANALSDVYVMGGEPKTALNIVGFPDEKLDHSILMDILRGGAERVKEARAVILGGHSVRDAEIKYGLAVTGVVDPKRMMTNDAAKPGNVLVLTKAIGTGFVTTAARADRCPEDTLQSACESMIALNRDAAAAAVEAGASAATDISGFGLAGHGCEMAQASGVSMEIQLSDIPFLPGVESLLDKKNYTRATTQTREALGDSVRFADEVDASLHALMFDPQTSGGILVAIAEDRLESLMERCAYAGVDAATVIGRVVEKADFTILVRR